MSKMKAIPRGIQQVRAEGNSNEIKGLIEGLNKAVADFKAYHQAELKQLRGTIDDHAMALAGQQMNGGGARAVQTLGVAALKQAKDNSSFAAMQTWEQGNCRLNVQMSVKAAALTNQNGQPAGGGPNIPSVPEYGGIRAPVLLAPRLLQILPSREVQKDAVQFIQLNATGDAAEQIHEGDEKAEIELGGALKVANIATIAGHTTASRQVLDDGEDEGLQQKIDNTLTTKTLLRLDDQLINGPGGQGRIHGLLPQATAFAPVIGETPADMIGEMIVTMVNEGYGTNLILMNPMDWFKLQLTRVNETDDEYVFGSPTAPLAASLWSTRIVPVPSLAAGNVLGLDTAHVTVLDRMRASVLLSNSHKDYFTRNLVLILAELRAGLEVADAKAVRKLALPAPGP
ncbi:phage major capsid protein [Lysobacter enzymogenes]|nr:phage major capsid protein [Lysobacter enzymogenes]